MSRRGDCHDNAPMESDWGTPEQTNSSTSAASPRRQAMAEIAEYIELFYNRQRIQARLDDWSPAAFEQRYHPLQVLFLIPLAPTIADRPQPSGFPIPPTGSMARPGRFTHQGEEIKCGMGGGFSDGSSQNRFNCSGILSTVPFSLTSNVTASPTRVRTSSPLAPDRDKIEPRREFLGAGVAE